MFLRKTSLIRVMMWMSVSVMVFGVVTACSSPTTTAPMVSPTAVGLPPAPGTVLPLQSPAAGQPTAVPVTATPGAVSSGSASATPTKFVSAAPTDTPAVPPTATKVASASSSSSAAPASVKPAALSGRIAYGVFLGGDDFKNRTIFVANLGTNVPGGQIIERASWPVFSPDGSKIAYFHWADGLYIANSNGTNAMGPLVISPGVCCMDWSRDGNWIVYADSPRPNQPGGPIKMVKLDGAYKTIVDLNVNGNGVVFSPDGKQIAYSGCLPNTSTCGVFTAPTDGSGKVTILSRDNGGNAQWSPDGKRIVYQSTDGTGHLQIFVMNADGTGAKQLTHNKGNDGQPLWSRDGGSILWRSDQNGTAWAIYAMNADGTNQRKVVDNAKPHPDLWGWDSMSVAP